MSRPTVVKVLPCVLTKTEINNFALQGSGLHEEYKKVEAEKKKTTSRFTTQMKTLRAELDRLSECVDTGIEKRPVNCFWQFYRARGLAELIREDTGEIVSSRDMTEQELQVSLSFATGPVHAGADEDEE